MSVKTLHKDMEVERGRLQEGHLFQSVYPPKLSAGLPKRHHVVVYLYVKLTDPFSADHLQVNSLPTLLLCVTHCSVIYLVRFKA